MLVTKSQSFVTVGRSLNLCAISQNLIIYYNIIFKAEHSRGNPVVSPQLNFSIYHPYNLL